MSDFNQKEFLRNYRHNPHRAFTQLMSEYRNRVYAFCLRVSSRREDAEDLAQEVFIRSWKGLDRFRGDSSLTTWIYRIAWNVCASHLDKKGRAKDMLSYQESDCDDEEESIGSYQSSQDDVGFKFVEDTQLLEVLFERIPEAHKLILTMYYLQELTYEEIAEVTGRPMGSVKATLHRAKANLREAALKTDSSLRGAK
ncbi:MAG: RNA polymerase sigma factor [Candidatus Hatepunaea meridiana]|nr:RNA polymerase sigma factor [Candidatus Hatepunaea meridiana]